MSFTDAEKVRIRHHLGYPNVGTAASLAFGIPIPLQTLFMVDSAMNRVLPNAEDNVRRFINIMDQIECRLVDALDYLIATKLGDLEIRQNTHDMLEKEYVRWGCRLADEMGVPVYAFATRYQKWMSSGSIPVRNS